MRRQQQIFFNSNCNSTCRSVATTLTWRGNKTVTTIMLTTGRVIVDTVTAANATRHQLANCGQQFFAAPHKYRTANNKINTAHSTNLLCIIAIYFVSQLFFKRNAISMQYLRFLRHFTCARVRRRRFAFPALTCELRIDELPV